MDATNSMRWETSARVFGLVVLICTTGLAGSDLFGSITDDLIKPRKLPKALRIDNPNRIVQLREVPELVIDLETFDYSVYEGIYQLRQQLQYFRNVGDVTIIDSDRDGLVEIIATEQLPHAQGHRVAHVAIYEMDADSLYVQKFLFGPETAISTHVGDSDGNGLTEIMINYTYVVDDENARTALFFEQPDSFSFPTDLNFTLSIDAPSGQFWSPTFLDTDNDGIQNFLYFYWGGISTEEWPNFANCVREYDAAADNYVLTWAEMDLFEFTWHYATGDFDLDGHPDFATASDQGSAIVVESQGNDQYEIVWTQELDTWNAYFSTMTEDMNGDGLPELWLGGDGTLDDPETRIWAFQSTGDNEYEEIFLIRIPYLFNWYLQNVSQVDFDNDGEPELAITTDKDIFIIKYQNDTFEVLYAMEHPYPAHSIGFEAVQFADLTNSEYPEIIISADAVFGSEGIPITEIYERVNVTSFYEPNPAIPSSPKLHCHPNPFNSSTKILIDTTGEHQVQVSIFDLLGGLIRSYLETISTSQSGYFYTWDGTDNEGLGVQSGLYIVVVDVGGEFLSKKVTLLK